MSHIWLQVIISQRKFGKTSTSKLHFELLYEGGCSCSLAVHFKHSSGLSLYVQEYFKMT